MDKVSPKERKKTTSEPDICTGRCHNRLMEEIRNDKEEAMKLTKIIDELRVKFKGNMEEFVLALIQLEERDQHTMEPKDKK